MTREKGSSSKCSCGRSLFTDLFRHVRHMGDLFPLYVRGDALLGNTVTPSRIFFTTCTGISVICSFTLGKALLVNVHDIPHGSSFVADGAHPKAFCSRMRSGFCPVETTEKCGICKPVMCLVKPRRRVCICAGSLCVHSSISLRVHGPRMLSSTLGPVVEMLVWDSARACAAMSSSAATIFAGGLVNLPGAWLGLCLSPSS